MEEPHWFKSTVVLRIGPSVVGGMGVFAKRDLPVDALVVTILQYLPTNESVIRCIEWADGNELSLALPLILTIAVLPEAERTALLQSYASDSAVPSELLTDLNAVRAQHELIYKKPGVARRNELKQIAAMVVTNNVAAPVEFEGLDSPFTLQIGCMGDFSCKINHPPEGQRANVLMPNLHNLHGLKAMHFSEVSDRFKMLSLLQLPYGIKQGEELFHHYGNQATHILNL